MWNAYTKYGASTRNLLIYADQPSEYEGQIRNAIYRLSPLELTRLLQRAVPETSHLVISTRPLPGDRSKAERKFASTYALEECHKLILMDEAQAPALRFKTKGTPR